MFWKIHFQKKIEMMNHLSILGVGHPRTGSKMLQILLNSWGLSTTHEGHGIDGIVSWQFATNADAPLPAYRQDELSQSITPKNYKFETIVYHIRDPFYSIPSIALTETFSLKFRSIWGNFEITDNPLNDAIKSILSWDKLILEKNPSFVFRIEYDVLNLYDFLKAKYGERISFTKNEINNRHNKRKHDGWKGLEKYLDSADSSLLQSINDFCEKYGYSKIFEPETKTIIRKNFYVDDLKIVPNSDEYFEFIRQMRTEPRNLNGFVEKVEITEQQQINYMEKYGDCYEICLSGNTPVGFVGVVDQDIRFAVHPNFHGKGIGTFMIWDLIHKKIDSKAKVKHDNYASMHVFEKCGFKLYNKDENFIYYSL